ncbi:mitochondrial ribosomal protein L53 [Anoplolepis gracilipes]|uniref:mitochondrial ribosomal protein L53 n=1 Tax=Anoplolepis gracilipes TaxID=354296 RepID=UPI003BA06F26
MSIHFSGSRSRSIGVMAAIIKHLKQVNLTPVKRIDFRFDPFYENVKETRRFQFYISAPRINATNPYCLMKTEIVCDRSEPTITFNLQSGEKVILKTALLTSLNILELYNKHISSLVPPNPAELEAKKELAEKKKKRKKPRKQKEGKKKRIVILQG